MMNEGNEVKLDPEIFAEFRLAAKEIGVDPDSLLERLVRVATKCALDEASYDAHFRHEVRLGLDAVSKGEVLADEAVARYFRERYPSSEGGS